MHYLRFLKGIHRALQPPTYLEIGIRNGGSLALSRARSVGIDPAYNVRAELACPVELHRTTSDEFFERPEPLGHFGGEPAGAVVHRRHAPLRVRPARLRQRGARTRRGGA